MEDLEFITEYLLEIVEKQNEVQWQPEELYIENIQPRHDPHPRGWPKPEPNKRIVIIDI